LTVIFEIKHFPKLMPGEIIKKSEFFVFGQFQFFYFQESFTARERIKSKAMTSHSTKCVKNRRKIIVGHAIVYNPAICLIKLG
jgi:hypothetical protein